MVKQPTSEQSEFTMSNEDFPALPGTQNSDGTTNAIGTSSGGIGAASGGGVGGSGITENNLDGTEKAMNSIVVSGVSGNSSAVVGVMVSVPLVAVLAEL